MTHHRVWRKEDLKIWIVKLSQIRLGNTHDARWSLESLGSEGLLPAALSNVETVAFVCLA